MSENNRNAKLHRLIKLRVLKSRWSRLFLHAGVCSLIFAITSCNSNGNEQSNDGINDTAGLEEPVIQTLECYRKVHDRDSIRIRYKLVDGKITGEMEFDNYQIDGSSGKIEGQFFGDTLKAWYDFRSEGMRSVREIYFLRKNGSLTRGIGDETIRHDTSFISAPSEVIFSSGETFMKVDCKDL